MEPQFEFTESRTSRVLLIWFGGLAVLMALAIAGAIVVHSIGANKALLWLTFGLILGGGCFVLDGLSKKHGATPIVVTVRADKLSVQDRITGAERHVYFNSIVSYQSEKFDGVEWLRIKLKDGNTEKIRPNNAYEFQPLAPLVREFEAAFAVHRQATGATVAVIREKTFFETRISIVLLLVIAGITVWTTWMVFTSDKGLGIEVFEVYVFFIGYSMAWLNAWAQRRAESRVVA